MGKIRVCYSKTGSAKHISHLDLMTTMQRSLIRAGVALKYSEGFNPHPHISVALPAPVGVESYCELMDVFIEGGNIREDMSEYMPYGLKILKAYRAWRNFSDIKWLDTQSFLIFNKPQPPEFDAALTACLTSESLVIPKRTKRGTADIDVAPHIKDVSISRADEICITINAKLSAQNPTIGLKDVLQIIERVCLENYFNDLNCKNIIMKRIDIYDNDMLLFK